MSRFAIDPPTLLRLAISEDEVTSAHRLVAPSAVRSHALNQLLEQVRNGVLSEEEALALHERITRMKIRVLGDRASRRTAWQIARQSGGSIFDAEYVAIARLQADALVATDHRLSAMAADFVPLAAYEALFSE
jgi:predicted nucleic acid-binding protein